ncbi:hypothetical protein [Streptomyces sp. NPDC096030]|uniref:hypothetical protein n=1 Tax=Streptomyces sp. NPDC096030 TaxID=3155423 RepID=UPI003333DAD8
MTCWATVELAEDGRRGWVNETEICSDQPGGARAAAITRIRGIARQRRRPVLVAATEPDGHRHHFVVTAEGTILKTHQASGLIRDPDAEETPAAYAARACAVCAALQSGQERTGLGLAVRLEKDIARAHGRDHPYRWRALELRAHAVALCGLPSTACELYLGAAKGWAALASPAYQGAARRAYALWFQAGEQQTRALWLGEQLRDVLGLGGDEASSARMAVVHRISELRWG